MSIVLFYSRDWIYLNNIDLTQNVLEIPCLQLWSGTAYEPRKTNKSQSTSMLLTIKLSISESLRKKMQKMKICYR